jgi:hypothetical protein
VHVVLWRQCKSQWFTWGFNEALQPTETEVERIDYGLWIHKIREKTKLRKLLQTLEVLIVVSV